MPHADVNGTSLFYDLTGPQGAPVVVLSNSLGTTLEMWDAQARALAPRLRVLRYDTRGHGRSRLGNGRMSIATLSDDIAGLLDVLGIERAHIAGLSLGGLTAQAFAIAHGSRVKSLVLMATAPHFPPPERWNTRVESVRKGGMAAVADSVLERWYTPAFAAADPGRFAYYRSLMLGLDIEGYIAACLVLRDTDVRSDLGRIAAPTLIVAGAHDQATPVAMSELIAASVPGALLSVIPDAAHLLAIERADAATGLLLDFIEKVEGRPLPVAAGADFSAGLAIRKSVLGVDYVQRSLAAAGSFAMPWQDFITRTVWSEVWGDDTLPLKTRSLLTLTLMIALNHEEEFKLHLRPALKNGVTPDELRSLLRHAAAYAGVPAANAAFRWVREALGAEVDRPDGA